MATLNVPTKACRGITVEGVSYDADRNGRLHVANERHARILRESAECFSVSAPPKRLGWICTVCSFATWFKTCGRCGGPCDKEQTNGKG